MLAPRSAARRAALLASICAAGVIAEQVGGKATRDALFLSSFGITALPVMLMVSAVLSLVIVPLGGQAMSALGPSRLVPLAFFGSAATLVVGSAVVGRFPRAVAVTMYLHIGSLGSVLISWFWSLINERFDPHTAKRYVSQIAAGAAVGGLVGGLLAERLARPLGVAGMLPVLAGLHVACGGLTLLLRGPGARDLSAAPSAYVPPPTNASARIVEKTGISSLWRSGYVRDLALLMSLGAIGASLLDYALKADAASSIGRGAPLLRFFGIYYTATAVGTLVVQVALTRRMLERFGLGRTVGTLPLTLTAGGVAALAAPRLWCLSIARGAESALRNSLFRSGYELFYTPMRPAEKRAVKTLIDVGGERVGDLVGGAMVTLVLASLPEVAATTMMIGVVVFGCVGLPVVRRLQRGYVATLERSLLDRGAVVELGSSLDQTTRSVILQTRPDVSFAELVAVGRVPALPSQPPPRSSDPIEERVAALRSGDRPRVEEALRDGPLTAALVPAAIDLLGWDEVAPAAMEALRRVSSSEVGALADALLDPSTEFTIRRRLPGVLAGTTAARAVEALLSGLDDQRFEVRYQCGRALARIRDAFPDCDLPVDRVHSAVMREVAVDRSVWESQRLLDRSEEATESPFVDRFLRDRANRSLEHVFMLLSFTLPRQPLIIAFRGLHASDDTLRGTALEYLELMLPAPIRTSLWPFIEEQRAPPRPPRPRAEILAALMESHASIELNLKLLRRDA